MSGLHTLLNVLEMRLGPPKHPQIDWIWTESHRLGTSKTSSNRLDLDRTHGPNPIDLRAEAHDFRFKSYYVTCVSDSGFGPIDLGPQNILKSMRFGPKVIGLGPPKHPQIDRI